MKCDFRKVQEKRQCLCEFMWYFKCEGLHHVDNEQHWKPHATSIFIFETEMLYDIVNNRWRKKQQNKE